MSEVRIIHNPDASAALDRVWIAVVRRAGSTVAAYGSTPDDAKAALWAKLRRLAESER
jgi:hypothetical protein